MKGLSSCCFQKLMLFWNYLYGMIDSHTRIVRHMTKIDNEADKAEAAAAEDPTPVPIYISPPKLEMRQGGMPEDKPAAMGALECVESREEFQRRRAHLDLVWNRHEDQEAS